MKNNIKIGIVICDRYRLCAGGKCFRALRDREGAFSIYKDIETELVGYTTCGGCPGGNIEYAPEEMIKNGAEVIHLATGFIVGYPPCPHLDHFLKIIPAKYGIKVVAGTHPIPEKYYTIHTILKTWDDPKWQEILQPAVADENIRVAYN
jgi:predicted metal-binding protein